MWGYIYFFFFNTVKRVYAQPFRCGGAWESNTFFFMALGITWTNGQSNIILFVDRINKSLKRPLPFFILKVDHPCEKKLAFLQLLRSSEAAEKIRKSFVKAGGIGTCGKAGFYAGLLKSRLLRSFYATLRKSCRKAGFSTAFTKLLRRAS